MDVSIGEHRGMFIFDRESVVMRKWQILEFDGKPYYAFVPENDNPIDASEIPEVGDVPVMKNESYEDGSIYGNEESLYNYECDDNSEMSHEDDDDEEADEVVTRQTKSGLVNGAGKEQENPSTAGDLYQVKVEGCMVTLEKLTENVAGSEEPKTSSGGVKQEPAEEISEYDVNETLMEIPEDEEDVEEEEAADREEHAVEAPEDKVVEDYDDDEDDPYEEEEEEEDEEEFEGTPAQPSSKGTLTKPPIPQRIAQLSGRSSSVAKTVGGPLKCKACSETFGSAIAFRKHVAWTHKKKVCIQEDGAYICAVCDYRTLKKSLFAAHLERKHETWARKREISMVFPCEVCGFACRSKHSLQSHFIRKHTDTYEHSCQFCEKKFKVKGDLTNHVRFHHKERPINCDVCGKLCQNTGSLYVHQKWAHYKPKFECHICRRRMVTQENLDQHLITQHEQREKIVCAQCGKTFTKKDSFKRHMAVHTGSKPHPCPICTKPFARQSQLRQHVLIHTGQRPFVCDICGKGFTQKPGLICHRKTHPGPLPPLPVMPIADLVREFIAQNEESQSQDHDLESINDDTDDRTVRWGALGEAGEVAQ